MGTKYLLTIENGSIKIRAEVVFWTFTSLKGKNIFMSHIGRQLTSLKNTDEILAWTMREWRKYGDEFMHEIVFPCLIYSIRWRCGYLLFRKKKFQKYVTFSQ